jgi:ribose transport system substrate-binding protein
MRYEGVRGVLAKHPGIEVVAEQSSGGERLKALQVAENMLTAHGDLDAFWAINDPSALGCVAAIEAAGRSARVFVVSVDGSPEAVEAIRAGKCLAASAAQYPQRIGAVGAEMALRALRGEKLEAFVPIRGELITAQNAAAYPGWK